MNNIHCFLCEQNTVLPVFVIFLLIFCARVGYSAEVNFQPYCDLTQYNVSPSVFLESSNSYECGNFKVDTYCCYPGTSQCLERMCHAISGWDGLLLRTFITCTDCVVTCTDCVVTNSLQKRRSSCIGLYYKIF